MSGTDDLGPFRVGKYKPREGLYPVHAERCIYVIAWFNDREEAEAYAAWRNTKGQT